MAAPTDVSRYEAPTPAVLPRGTFHADLVDGVWRWSDDVFALHGLAPGQIVPTTDALLAHVHPEDRHGVEKALADAPCDGVVSTLHRMAAVDGRERTVCLTGQILPGVTEGRRWFSGQLVDLTAPISRMAARLADVSIQAAAQSRADIEQAKAVVKLVLDVDDDEAFVVLRRCSNTTNVALRAVAARLVHEARHARLTPEWLASVLQPGGTVSRP